jgi:hypothetical protein
MLVCAAVCQGLVLRAKRPDRKSSRVQHCGERQRTTTGKKVKENRMLLPEGHVNLQHSFPLDFLCRGSLECWEVVIFKPALVFSVTMKPFPAKQQKTDGPKETNPVILLAW